MAINQNHLFEDLDGIKCAIVEKNVSAQRLAFLKSLLGYNGYTVVVVPSPPPKAAPTAVPAPAKPSATQAQPSATQAPASPSTPAPAPAPAPVASSATPTPSSAPAAAIPASTPVPPAPDLPAASAPVPAPAPAPPALPETYTVGVTDTAFNPVNAIFGRLLRTPGGQVVTLAYWQETEKESHDEIPYFEAGKP